MSVGIELISRWRRKQALMAEKMRIEPLAPLPRFVAGADAAFDEKHGRVLAAAVVYDRIEKRIVEVAGASRPIEYPYIPGYLSFREGPAVLQAVRKLKMPWGVICFDGQGIAHPRRCGIATHLSIMLDRPGVGFGKSRLIGTFDEPGNQAGSRWALMDQDEQIGVVLRTQTGIRPIFVSVGHRVDLPSAIRLALACVGKYRIPEPTRQADLEVARMKREQIA
jgi:deoxyribonuclease V